MNKTFLIGRITKDIEVRISSNDNKVCQFTIAVNRTYKNKEGKYEADFINCIAFRNTAELLGKYFKKGNQVCIEGRIQTRNYEDDKKVKHYITEVLVENIMLLEKREKKEDLEIPQNTTSQYDTISSDIQLEDKDLPF